MLVEYPDSRCQNSKFHELKYPCSSVHLNTMSDEQLHSKPTETDLEVEISLATSRLCIYLKKKNVVYNTTDNYYSAGHDW